MQIHPKFQTTQFTLDIIHRELSRAERDFQMLKAQMMTQDLADLPLFRFNGSDYNRAMDDKRLTGQCLRVWDAMKDGQWRTLDEIAGITGDPQASVSAQLRHLRKERFGSHTVDKRPRGERETGLYEYRLIA